MNAKDSTPDSTADQQDAGRWMTFADLADARRISKASAIKLVRRHGWRRQRDNKGNVLALVPLPWAQDTEGPEGDSPRTVSDTVGRTVRRTYPMLSVP
jgi:hypothetical protein